MGRLAARALLFSLVIVCLFCLPAAIAHADEPSLSAGASEPTAGGAAEAEAALTPEQVEAEEDAMHVTPAPPKLQRYCLYVSHQRRQSVQIYRSNPGSTTGYPSKMVTQVHTDPFPSGIVMHEGILYVATYGKV